MLSLWLVLIGSVVLGLSGFPSYLTSNLSLAHRARVITMVAGSLSGLTGLVVFFVQGEPLALHWCWFLPVGAFSVGLDSLSAVFLALVFFVPSLGSLYSLGYWPASKHHENSRRLGLSYGLLAGSMVMVVLSRDAVLFLLSWELMALAAFFAATAENDKPEVAKAGWIYLVATHIGTLFLFGMFTLWSHETGSFALEPRALPAFAATAIFFLGFVGFGFKAGLMPLHVWLPGAHANAPSHVSAVMSGVMLKMGIYGVLRLTSLLPIASEWWGIVVLVVGAVTGLGGIVFALGQQDLKKLLAYSSIENIGIITMGIGLALLGRYYGRADWILLGMGASLFHVLNHGLFKPLLFLGAGAVIHSAQSRDLDKMGGLGRKMPRLAALFLVGAVAISALPPLNGFASEWLLYLGFFHSLAATGGLTPMMVACTAAVLALIGALVLACFVKLFGTVFLGTSRKDLTAEVCDPGLSQLLPMGFLALACVILGFFPALATTVLDSAVGDWSGVHQGSISDLAPQLWLGWAGLGIVLLAGAASLVQWLVKGRKRPKRQLTWDCGYAEPTPRMQYTGSSLGQSIVVLFGFALRPRAQRPDLRALFPARTQFHLSVPDFVLERLVLPLFKGIIRQAPRIRILQQGQTQVYLLYVFLATILLLLFSGVGANHG